MLVVHESGMALPVIFFPAVREPSLSMNMKRGVLDMFESNHACTVFEMNLSHPLFVGAQETGSHDWTGFRAAVNDDFMIG